MTPQKAIVTPAFGNKTVLVRDPWDYVDMWLRREKHDKAIKYWNQARNFYQASKGIPNTASPLTLYYAFLNATKTLLTVKGRTFVEQHGTSGTIGAGKTNLQNEIVTFKPNGILSSLCKYFDEPCNNETYSVKALLYNLPFVHRCFNLTFPTGFVELFIPVLHPRFVIMDGSHDAWFCAELAEHHTNQHIVNKVTPMGYERDIGVAEAFIIRKRTRFSWYRSGPQKAGNLTRLRRYHKNIRRDLLFIPGDRTLWYLKRRGQPSAINRHPLTLTFAAMHRLSELARYKPTVLYRHFELKQNWLLSEFIAGAPFAFIDEMACEITNEDYMPPGVR